MSETQDVAETETAVQAVVSDVTSPAVLARISALESAVANTVKAPTVENLAATVSQAAADAAEAKTLATDAASAVSAVKSDVSDVQSLWTEMAPVFTKLRTFFSHML
jgi:hypothetical protein